MNERKSFFLFPCDQKLDESQFSVLHTRELKEEKEKIKQNI